MRRTENGPRPQRPDRRDILDEWIERVVTKPEAEVVQADKRIRRWARIAEASHNVELQRAHLTDTKIYSPVDAVVEYRSLEPGEVVSPGTSILTLIDLKNLWVRIDLEQGDITRVKPGQKAEILTGFMLEYPRDMVVSGLGDLTVDET